ncbi:MAG: type II secretion system F family protein [Candidatus Paceibacterota bacterium]
MPIFKYTGEDKEGNRVIETVEADDRYAVYDIARQAGHRVSGVEEGGGGFRKFIDVEKINSYLSRVSADEKIIITRNLGSMISAGLTVTRALSVIQRQTENPRLKQIISKLIEQIENGKQFYEALGDFRDTFGDMYIAMVKAGEEGGKLAEALQTLAVQMERSNNLTKKVKGAMIYPAIVILVMIIIAVLMMIYVMPQITGVFKNMNMDLPATTVFLIGTSDFFVEHTVLALGSIVGVVIGFIYFLRSQIGKFSMSWLVTRLPVIGTMAKETNAARTARTLSSLLNSGVDVMQSIEITEEVVQNVFYKRILSEARARVEKGTPLSEIFIERKDLYPVLVGEMILVGEETGQISGMLGELAVFYETEVERKTKDLSTIIEPLLMVVIGVAVGFFALALIAPIYSISDGLQ